MEPHSLPPAAEEPVSRGSKVTPLLLAEPSWEDRRARRAQEWQRVVFYLVGGAFSLFILQLIARQMNPPDAALLNADTGPVLGLWDGEWSGRETRYSLSGEKLAEYKSHISFWCSTSKHQSVTITRTTADGKVETERRVHMIDQDGHLVSRRTEDASTRTLYTGRYESGELFWNVRSEELNHLIRSRISGDVLHYEELYTTNGAPDAGYLLSGTFTRVEKRTVGAK